MTKGFKIEAEVPVPMRFAVLFSLAAMFFAVGIPAMVLLAMWLWPQVIR